MTRGDLNHRQSVHAAASHKDARVKMGDWNFLGGILEEVHIHSTMVGKIWLTILFIFRMLVLGVAAEDVWNDEQSDFICNTEQPGCRNVCYDLAFPISLIRYWVLQVIFVSSPSLVYMGHALYRLRALEKERQRKKIALRRELEEVDIEQAEVRRRIEREMRQLDQSKLNKAPLRGSLLRTYVAHIMMRSAVEVGFMTGQYILYGFQLEPLFKCEREPCPNAVDCFVSRPTEKSVFMVFMQCIAFISLFLNILEIMHLGYKALKKGILDIYPHLRDDVDDSYYPSRYKKDSVVPQAGMAVGRKSTLPSAPGGYNLLMEKPPTADASPPYPSIITPQSAFIPVQGGGDSSTTTGGNPKSVLPDAPKESAHSPTEYNSNSNNTSSETRSGPSNSITPPKPDDGEDQLHAPLPDEERERERASPESPRPPRDSSLSSCPTLPVSAIKRPWKVTAPWHCSTVVEGNTSEADSLGSAAKGRASVGVVAGGGGGSSSGGSSGVAYASARGRSGSRSKRHSRPCTPDSIEETSSESHASPLPPLSPRRTSVASSSSSRRNAPTDLQI